MATVAGVGSTLGGSVGTAAGSATASAVGVSEAQASRDRGAGKSKRQKRRTVVEVDGKLYEVNSAAEAESLLEATLQKVERRVTKQVAKAVARGNPPPVAAAPVVRIRGEAAPEVRLQLEEYRSKVRDLLEYATGLYAAEMAEMEDEEVILLMAA